MRTDTGRASVAKSANSRTTIPLWQIPLYADIVEEVNPSTDHHRFRDIRRIYDRDDSFWKIPSPEPELSTAVQSSLSSFIVDARLTEAASQLAAQVAEQYSPSSLLIVAILRAGVPIASWLTKLLPGSVAVATSLFVGVGIDQVAFETIRRDYPNRELLFVDGWTGRGSVANELKRLNQGSLAVLCDPWSLADFRGTTEDVLSPSAFFTGPTTMGFSRTFTRAAEDMFAAFRFPPSMLQREWVDRWINAGPVDVSTRNSAIHNSAPDHRATTLRVHANEVARAMINSNPKRILFLDTAADARIDFELLFELADARGVGIEFGVRSLKRLGTRVACEIKAN